MKVPPRPGGDFQGIGAKNSPGNGQRVADMPFTSVQITDLSGNGFAIGELRAAPEPSTPIILGSGVLILVGLMRRKLLR